MSQASSAATSASAAAFDFTSLFAHDLPQPAARWGGFSKYHFIGGNNDADAVPVDDQVRVSVQLIIDQRRTLVLDYVRH